MPTRQIKSKYEAVKRVLLAVRSIYWLTTSLQHTKRGRVSKSRSYLNRVLNSNAWEFDFIVAYDAILMIGEDRHDEALERFREAYSDMALKFDSDSQYIKHFCQYYECLLVQDENCASFKNEAMRLDTTKTVKNFLRFPPSPREP